MGAHGYLDRQLLVRTVDPLLRERFWPVSVLRTCFPSWSVGFAPGRYVNITGRIWAVHAWNSGKPRLSLGVSVAYRTMNPFFFPIPVNGSDEEWTEAIREAVDWLAYLMKGADVDFAVPERVQR